MSGEKVSETMVWIMELENAIMRRKYDPAAGDLLIPDENGRYVRVDEVPLEKRVAVDFATRNGWLEVYDFGPSMTRQDMAQECDINVIMKQYEATGTFTHIRGGEPRYLDVSAPPDLQSALNFMIEAEAAFMSLPASVRKQFDNDPQQFVAYAEKPENLEQMRKWNLAPPEKAADAPIEVRVVPDPANSNAPGGTPMPAVPAPVAK